MKHQYPEEKAKKQMEHLHLRKHCHNKENTEYVLAKFSLCQLAN